MHVVSRGEAWHICGGVIAQNGNEALGETVNFFVWWSWRPARKLTFMEKLSFITLANPGRCSTLGAGRESEISDLSRSKYQPESTALTHPRWPTNWNFVQTPTISSMAT